MILTVRVSAEILAQRLDDPDWVVFNCRHDLADPARGRVEYEKSHIPGARFLHLDEDLSAPKTGTNGRHPLPDPDVLIEKLGRAGVDSRKQVVARSEEHTSELQSQSNLVCRLLLEKKKKIEKSQ